MTITDTRTEPTTTGSAYPPSIADLMPKARKLAESEGLPSRNRVMTTLKVGAPKARQILAGLAAEGYEPTTEPRPQTAKSEPLPEPAPVASDPVRVEAAGAGIVPEVIEPVASETTVDESADAEIPSAAPVPAEPSTVTEAVEASQGTAVADPDTTAGPETKKAKPITAWPVWLLLLPASVAIWSGWVGLGKLAGFGPINPLPGIWDSLVIDTSITLPIGMETYSAYALYVWLSGRASVKAIRFARASAIAGLVIGGAGQVAYHLMAAANVPAAHPLITAAVACIPVAVLGMGAALAHLVKNHDK